MATYNPSTPVGGHVTVDLDWLALVPAQIDGVQARGGVTVEQRLGTVPGVSVQHASYTKTQHTTASSKQHRLLIEDLQRRFNLMLNSLR